MRFCREFLSGEGNVIRHLSLLGYVVSYEQTHLDEYDFTVTHMASDLRDGVRLAKLVDTITEKSPR